MEKVDPILHQRDMFLNERSYYSLLRLINIFISGDSSLSHCGSSSVRKELHYLESSCVYIQK